MNHCIELIKSLFIPYGMVIPYVLPAHFRLLFRSALGNFVDNRSSLRLVVAKQFNG